MVNNATCSNGDSLRLIDVLVAFLFIRIAAELEDKAQLGIQVFSQAWLPEIFSKLCTLAILRMNWLAVPVNTY